MASNQQRKEEVERHIHALVQEGRLLSSREVMRRMGRADDRVIREDWDGLAAEGKVPERSRSTNAREKSHGFRPGRTLLEVKQSLLRFQAQFTAASDEHRRLGQEFWLRHLAEIECLLGQTWGMVTSNSLETMLEEVQHAETRKDQE